MHLGGPVGDVSAADLVWRCGDQGARLAAFVRRALRPALRQLPSLAQQPVQRGFAAHAGPQVRQARHDLAGRQVLEGIAGQDVHGGLSLSLGEFVGRDVRRSLLRCSAVAQGNGWVQPALHGARGQAHHSACRRCAVLHCAAAKSLGNSSAPALATPPMRGRLSQPLSVPRLTLSSRATASSVRLPRSAAFLQACSLNSVQYRFRCMACRSCADHPLEIWRRHLS